MMYGGIGPAGWSRQDLCFTRAWPLRPGGQRQRISCRIQRLPLPERRRLPAWPSPMSSRRAARSRCCWRWPVYHGLGMDQFRHAAYRRRAGAALLGFPRHHARRRLHAACQHRPGHGQPRLRLTPTASASRSSSTPAAPAWRSAACSGSVTAGGEPLAGVRITTDSAER